MPRFVRFLCCLAFAACVMLPLSAQTPAAAPTPTSLPATAPATAPATPPTANATATTTANAGQDTPAEGKKAISGKGLWDTFQRGGKVMWPILICSIVGLMFIFDVLWRTRRGALLPHASIRAIAGVGRPAASRIVELINGAPDVAFHRILKAGFIWRHGTNEQITAAVEESVDTTLWRLKQAARPIGILANVAPLLGLLGTVTGIISAFDVVATQGSLGDPAALADGISQALLTTAFGLIVAIPLLLTFYYLNGRSEQLLRHAEELAKEALLLPPEAVLGDGPLSVTPDVAPAPASPPATATPASDAPSDDASPASSITSAPEKSGKSSRSRR